MSKKTHRNTTKFETINYLAQGLNGGFIPTIDLAGKIKTGNRYNRKKGIGPDLGQIRSSSEESGPASGPCVRTKGYAALFVFLASHDVDEARQGTARMVRRLRWFLDNERRRMRGSRARGAHGHRNGEEWWSVALASLLDTTAVGADGDEDGTVDSRVRSSIPRAKMERTTRRCCWWSCIWSGSSHLPAMRDGSFGCGSVRGRK
jgi:hypothetical protein